jgi:hypothetical protein
VRELAIAFSVAMNDGKKFDEKVPPIKNDEETPQDEADYDFDDSWIPSPSPVDGSSQ